jgi:endonuclease YncB( thermonuclease family)
MNVLMRYVCLLMATWVLLITGCRNSSQSSPSQSQAYDFDQSSDSNSNKINADREKALRLGQPGARHYPLRFQLLNGRDVGRVVDGRTFVVNLPGVHPLFGENMPVRVRGLHALDLPPARTEDLPDAIAQWDQLRKLIENAQKIELRRLERGKDKLYLVADVYLDGEFLSQQLCAGPPLPSD